MKRNFVFDIKKNKVFYLKNYTLHRIKTISLECPHLISKCIIFIIISKNTNLKDTIKFSLPIRNCTTYHPEKL